MNIEFDVTLQCNFSCVNCNRHSNFNDIKDPTDPTNKKKVPPPPPMKKKV